MCVCAGDCNIEGSVGGHYLDEWGAANLGSDKNEGVCLARAKDIWTYCQNSAQQKVTATFLDTGKSATYPNDGKFCNTQNVRFYRNIKILTNCRLFC